MLRALVAGVVVLSFSSACTRPVAPDLTGVWEERDARGMLISLWSFEGDGRFTFDHLPEPTPEDAEHLSGTFQIIDGSELYLDALDVGARVRLRRKNTFYSREDLLAPEAFLAVNSQSELPGTWHQDSFRQTLDMSGQVVFQDSRTQTLDLQSDGKLRLVETIDDQPPEEEAGHYQALDNDLYQFTLDLDQVSISFTEHHVNGEALAATVYHRTPHSAYQ